MSSENLNNHETSRLDSVSIPIVNDDTNTVTASEKVDTATQKDKPASKATLMQARGRKMYGNVRSSVQNYDYWMWR